MPDQNVQIDRTRLRPATSAERERWSSLLWQTIANVRKGQSADWTVDQLTIVAREIDPPFNAKGDPDYV